MKTLVIAGNSIEAQHWIITDLEQRYPSNTSLSMSDYIIVHSPDVLRGMRDPIGRFIGTWQARTDLFELLNALLVIMSPENTAHKIIMNLLVQHIIKKPK